MALKRNNKSWIVLILGVFLFGMTFLGFLVSVSNKAFAATGNATGNVWSDQSGWIGFGCANCNSNVTNTNLTGYAWSANYGWINLAPTSGGVTNNSSGVLAGYAWGEKLGWINFSGVTINTSTGNFAGTASGSIVGTLNFSCANCNVNTTWRPAACGNGICSSGETCTTCPQDCGTCGGGGGVGHYECNYITQKCDFISGVSGANTCSTDIECQCDPHGDFNRDGKINITDFSIMMYFWEQVNPSNACVDINHDTVVNIKDFSIMLYWWTK